MLIGLCWILLCMLLLGYMKQRLSDALPCATFIVLLFVYIVSCFCLQDKLQIIMGIIDFVMVLFWVRHRDKVCLILIKEDISVVTTIFITVMISFGCYGSFKVLMDGEFQYYVIAAKQIFLTDSLGGG